MITRIELDGFKTFHRFALDLEPMQVIVGPNAAGKSNLFDAILFLSQMAETDLRTAFRKLRGEAGELFTVLPDGRRTTQMQLAVEMLVDREVRDSWGAEAVLGNTRLRYELSISRHTDSNGLERMSVESESLTPIRRQDDTWVRRLPKDSQKRWAPRPSGRTTPFIATVRDQGVPTIYLHQDGRQGRKGNVAAKIERTVLSGVQNTEFPHAFAARNEMLSWRLLQLNPEVLREPSSMIGSQVMAADGRFLPGALARLQAQDPSLIADITRDLGNLVPGIVRLEVEADRTRDEYVIWATMQDGRRFSSRVLSDGTLRMLALLSLKNDPEHRGVVLFEEPENGIHPFRLKNLAKLLSDLATDFTDPDQFDVPLRQFLCNTHSPVFVSQPDILPHVVFAHTVLLVDPATSLPAQRVTRMVPIRSSSIQPGFDLPISQEEQAYTLEEVKAYLESADPGEAVNTLSIGVNQRPWKQNGKSG